jgi:DNA polymerase III delta subunit
MFSPFKIVIIMEIETALKTKSNETLLKELIEHHPDTTTLILTTTSNKKPAILNKLGDKIEAAIFWRKFENELSSYIIHELTKANKRIDSVAAEEIINLCGRNRQNIDEAINILINGSNETNITSKVVHTLLVTTGSLNIFEFVETLFLGNKKAIMEAAIILQQGTHELVLMALILKKLNQLDNYFLFLNQGINKNEIYKKLGLYNQKQLLNFQKSLQRFKTDKIKNLFVKFTEVETKIKSGQSSKDLLTNPFFRFALFHTDLILKSKCKNS